MCGLALRNTELIVLVFLCGGGGGGGGGVEGV